MKPVYKKMLSLMEAKEKGKRSGRREPWYLYILRCRDGKLYTGVTKDLERRFKMHNAGRASRFTRVRLPVEMLHQEKLKNRTAALIRECAVKALPRQKKEALIDYGKNRKNLKKKKRRYKT